MNKILCKLSDLINAKNIKYSIDNVSRAYQLLGEPLKNIKVIHIAGTNGKGSVSNKIAKALMLAGYKIGLFTSPHITTVRERIIVDFSIISENDFEKELSALFEALESFKISLSFFEVLTLLACIYFKKRQVDFAVMETGLGGRLDATNVLEASINIITSIGYDHQYLLGNTLAQIAKEKAGIIKSNVPTVLGPKALYKAILERANKFSSKVSKVTDSFLNYDEENQNIAQTALKLLKDNFFISDDSISKGIKSRPICRFEVFELKNLQGCFSKNVILDVAHNIDGLKRLKEMLDQRFNVDKYVVVLGMSKDKDIDGFCKYLQNFAKEIHLAKSFHPRLVEPQAINDLLSVSSYIHESFSDAMKVALEKDDEHILVLGSFYFMSEVREVLGIKQVSDQVYLNDPVLKL